MAIKLKVHERCQRCGQIAVQRVHDRIMGWHDCPNAPPGPADAPMNFHINEITFIPDTPQPAPAERSE